MGGYDLLPPGKSPLRPKRPSYAKIGGVLCVASLFGVFAYHSLVERPITTSMTEGLPDDEHFDAEGGDHPEGRRGAELTDKSTEAGGKASAESIAVVAPASDEVVDISIAFGDRKLGLRLKLLPEFSQSSVAFLKEAAAASCPGELYRSEHSFLIQGRISCATHHTKVVKGDCPPGASKDPNRQCPSHDPNCGCHGPIMKRGMVGWAGGSAGPDFFVYIGEHPATHWSHDHTVFAEIADENSWHAIEELGKLPTHNQGMTYFNDKIKLTVQQSGS